MAPPGSEQEPTTNDARKVAVAVAGDFMASSPGATTVT